MYELVWADKALCGAVFLQIVDVHNCIEPAGCVAFG